MTHALNCIKEVASLSNRVILFHSGGGKDSIALLDMMHPFFDEIVCVYLYVVKDLEHINKYIRHAERKYPKARFIYEPHFSVSHHLNDGYMGCKRAKVRKIDLSMTTKMVKKNLGIDYAIFGSKQSDSMDKRVMLRTYRDEMFNDSTKNVYPLSKYKNKDVLYYISKKKLLKPIVYGKGQSQGTNIANIPFLY